MGYGGWGWTAGPGGVLIVGGATGGCGALPTRKRWGPGIAPAEYTGGPLFIKLLDALVGGMTGGALIGGDVKGLGLGRAPKFCGGGPSGRIGGEPPGGGTPETGATALPIDDEREPSGGLDPKDGGWPGGGPVGLPGATLGGNVDNGGPEGGPAGLTSVPGGGPGRENGGEEAGIPAGEAEEGGKGGGWLNGGGLETGFEVMGGRLRFKFCILSASESGVPLVLGM